MSPKVFSSMGREADFGEDVSSDNALQELWPLGEVDPKKARFPCCVVWTPLPVVSWLAPYIGHVGICQEDGAILDFAGSNLVSMDNFAYGSVARYIQLDRKKCCFPANLAAHVCKRSYNHTEFGTAISWDDTLHSGMRHFQHKFYNLFTCNCHSFVSNCLNRLAYDGSVEWNVLNVAAIVWLHGQWVDKMSVVRSFFPFLTVTCIGILMAGWSFLIGMAAFSCLLIGWFVLTVYCFKGVGKKAVELRPQTQGGDLHKKAYAMADALRTSIYQIVSAFEDDLQVNAKPSSLEKNWISEGRKPVYGSHAVLIH